LSIARLTAAAAATTTTATATAVSQSVAEKHCGLSINETATRFTVAMK